VSWSPGEGVEVSVGLGVGSRERVDLSVKTKRLTTEPDTDIVRLTWATVTEMATLFDLPHQTFVTHLISFTPEPAPRRRLGTA
jgi:hypothetical protein